MTLEEVITGLKRLSKKVEDLEDTPSGTYIPGGVKATVVYPSSPIVTGNPPGGSDTQIQFNDNGSFGGNSRLTFDKAAGGDVLLAAGDGSSNAGGDITIRAGSTDHTHTKGNVILQPGKNNDNNGGNVGRVVFKMYEGDSTGNTQIAYDIDGQGTIFKLVTLGGASTTNATPDTLFSGSTFLNADESVLIEAIVTARRTGGSSGSDGDSAAYILRGLYQKVGAGSATLIGSVSQTVIAESQAGWDATLITSGDTITVQVTGAANNDVTWVVEMRSWYPSLTV